MQGTGDFTVQLRPEGQAQVWGGATEAVLWECTLQESARRRAWRDTLAAFWRAVEGNVAAAAFFTQPHEPAFAGDYVAFLARLGYGPDP